MRNLGKIMVGFLGLFLLSGCTNYDNLTIYTTAYPIEYLTSVLYEENRTIQSIYPNGSDVYSYEVTDLQISTYSKGDIFIYNGTSEEKEIAKDLHISRSYVSRIEKRALSKVLKEFMKSNQGL